MKLTKQERSNHEQALRLLRKGDSITFGQVEFVHRHLRPDATTDIGKGSAFFTPWDIVSDFLIETLRVDRRPVKILDLCAGYGILSHRKWLMCKEMGNPLPEVTCVEINPEYVAIGKQLFPQAEWICMDALDVPDQLIGRQFDEFYSNPPFGAIGKESWGERKTKKPARWEYAIAEIGMSLCDTGTMICQQGITNWKISGCQSFVNVKNEVYEKWSSESGIRLANNCGIDCSHTRFAETNVMIDICCIERVEVDEPECDDENSECPEVKVLQKTLF